MSSINSSGRKPLPGSVDRDDKSNLSEIAKADGLFQHNELAQDGAEEAGAAKGTQGGKGGKIGKGAGKHAAAQIVPNQAAAPDAVVAPALLPQNMFAVDGSPSQPEAADVEALAKSQTTDEDVTDAASRITADVANEQTTQAQYEQDIGSLTAALNQAGITTPASTILQDLIDPKGTGSKVPAALLSAAKDKNIDLSVDSTDVEDAQGALEQAIVQIPLVQAAVDLATAHVTRVSALAGQTADEVLGDVASGIPDSNKNGLAALYAAAAKNGVDLTDKGADSISEAKNNKIKSEQNKQIKQAQKDAAAQQNSSSGGSSTPSANSGATGNVSYAGGKPSNTQTYQSLAKTGAGSSYGGYDTSGNESIAPNPDNPVDFEKDYGIKGGFTSESLDDLLAKVPQLTSQYPDIKNILTNAAASATPPIPPQLLLSTLGVETSFATNYGTNAKDGPFQFIETTFTDYGTGDRTNMTDAANAAANYYSTILKDNNMDLFAAMRDYNGDINQGASNSYQKDQQDIFNGNMNLG